MNAVQITRHGGSQVLKKTTLPDPQPSAGQTLIEVKAAGVNFADIMMRMGLYPEAPKPPFTPGYEIAGVVIRGEKFKAGDRVMAATAFGGYSSQIAVNEDQVRAMPAGMDFENAAAVPVNYLTAWAGLMEQARIRATDRVLITSAAGGVGTAAIQISRHMGAKTIGLVGSEAKKDFVRRQGADEVWTLAEWHQRAGFGGKKAGAEKFDVIFDSMGGDHLKLAFRQLTPLGRVVSFGVSDMVGPSRNIFGVARHLMKTPFFSQFKLQMTNKGVFGLNMLKLLDHAHLLQTSFDQVVKLLGSGQLRPHVDRRFSFSEAPAAHDYLQSRQSKGKVVLIPD